jgi:hypothetical protein
MSDTAAERIEQLEAEVQRLKEQVDGSDDANQPQGHDPNLGGRDWSGVTRRGLLTGGLATLLFSQAGAGAPGDWRWSANQHASGYTIRELGGVELVGHDVIEEIGDGLAINGSGQLYATGGGGDSGGTDTRADVSDDGSTVVTSASDINFADGLSASADGDGSATVSSGYWGAGSTTDMLEPQEDIGVEVDNLIVRNGRGFVWMGLPHFGEYGSGLSDEQIGRIELGANDQLHVSRLSLHIKSGGSNANLGLDVTDATNGTVLETVDGGGKLQSGSTPVAVSSIGVDIELQLTTGGSGPYTIQPVMMGQVVA